MPTGSACCDTQTYPVRPLTEIIRQGGGLLGSRVQVLGLADDVDGAGIPGACSCVGTVCECPRFLALRGVVCGEALRLGGSYRSRPVECSDAGCWPLTPLVEYAVCGTVTADPIEETALGIALAVDAFCAE